MIIIIHDVIVCVWVELKHNWRKFHSKILYTTAEKGTIWIIWSKAVVHNKYLKLGLVHVKSSMFMCQQYELTFTLLLPLTHALTYYMI